MPTASKIVMSQGEAPLTPPINTSILYVKSSDGKFYTKDSNDAETLLGKQQILYGGILDGNGSPITAGKKIFVRVPTSGIITSAYIMADVLGSISVEVWKDTFSNFPPTSDDKISSNLPISLTSSQSNEITTLTGWITTVSSGDVLCFYVSELATLITWCSVGVKIE
jgi:hypothetical protein